MAVKEEVGHMRMGDAKCDSINHSMMPKIDIMMPNHAVAPILWHHLALLSHHDISN